MYLSRILFITTIACAPNFTYAQAYPNKPVTFVVPFAPGGTNDLVGRPLAQKLSDAMGRPVLIDNRGGAGGTIGSARVATAAPDGYTLLIGSAGPLGTAPGYYKNIPYDPVKDFAPISLLMTSPIILLVNPVVPAKSVTDLVGLAKSMPKQLNYGSPGTGSMNHLAGELFNVLAKVQLIHVPYKGSGPALVDLMAGRLDLMFAPVAPTLVQIKAGKLRPIAVGTQKRFSVFPDLPTISETGVPSYDVSQWWGILAPAKTPGPIINRLNSEIVKILNSHEIKDFYTGLGGETSASSPEQFSTFIQNEVSKWTKIQKDAGISD